MVHNYGSGMLPWLQALQRVEAISLLEPFIEHLEHSLFKLTPRTSIGDLTIATSLEDHRDIRQH